MNADADSLPQKSSPNRLLRSAFNAQPPSWKAELPDVPVVLKPVNRTVASPEQVTVLRAWYEKTGPEPTKAEMNEASSETGLNPKWIRNWIGRQRRKRPSPTKSKGTRKYSLSPKPTPWPTHGDSRGTGAQVAGWPMEAEQFSPPSTATEETSTDSLKAQPLLIGNPVSLSAPPFGCGEPSGGMDASGQFDSDLPPSELSDAARLYDDVRSRPPNERPTVPSVASDPLAPRTLREAELVAAYMNSCSATAPLDTLVMPHLDLDFSCDPTVSQLAFLHSVLYEPFQPSPALDVPLPLPVNASDDLDSLSHMLPMDNIPDLWYPPLDPSTSTSTPTPEAESAIDHPAHTPVAYQIELSRLATWYKSMQDAGASVSFGESSSLRAVANAVGGTYVSLVDHHMDDVRRCLENVNATADTPRSLHSSGSSVDGDSEDEEEAVTPSEEMQFTFGLFEEYESSASWAQEKGKGVEGAGTV
ncbi:uncharacterized protein BXZ73DRAFT_103591 [Epithele typhae]|uniref:uncharacterized protein n=1 Tax=Epithele typhae TaxID=378194 RepID=UPI002007711F|nr:uncharacterized protein BXZ73DRAFT_103591 [Epithele typhae]KAH9924303.1 hypothetical protein BXZ73DRAFT_103591 [Epithele typhae]